jgi:UTP-glucose-1-phosphate uridylyltransferase/acetyltransferase-like isoleucine patch superfamily enzyme
LLPTTKAVPKELLPVEGKPAIQWVLEEAIDAGLREFILVVSPRKAVLRDYLMPLNDDHPLASHFDLSALERLLKAIKITFVEQPHPQGLGDSILRCRELIGEEPFALLLPDNICPIESQIIKRLRDAYFSYGKSCLALRRVETNDLHCGAIVAQPWREALYTVQRVLPKQAREDKITNLRGIGRYILEPEVFAYLEQGPTDGELDDVPALDELARNGHLLGLLVSDRVYHLGSGINQGEADLGTMEIWEDVWKFEVPGHRALWSLHRTLRQEIKARWRRAVPFADELFDRWERAAFLGFGKDASIYDSSLVMGNVQVGEGTWVGPFTVLDGQGGLIIGRYCSISAGAQLYSHDTVQWALTGGKAPEVRQPTRIEDCSYIGPMSIVGKGVTVGEHSVIGANSFVNQDVPPFSIAVGNPAQVIGQVELVGDADVRFVYVER